VSAQNMVFVIFCRCHVSFFPQIAGGYRGSYFSKVRSWRCRNSWFSWWKFCFVFFLSRICYCFYFRNPARPEDV
jgi:hypothetical protein